MTKSGKYPVRLLLSLWVAAALLQGPAHGENSSEGIEEASEKIEEASEKIEQVAEPSADLESPAAASSQRDTLLTVRDGDTLLSIADRLLEQTDHYTRFQLVDAMRRTNSLVSDVVRPGQNLLLELSASSADSLYQLPGVDDVRGVYVNAALAGSGRILDLVTELKKVGGNTVVFDVKDRPGDLSYPSEIPLADEIESDAGAPISRPKRLVDRLHREGIYVVARLTCFYDQRLAQNRPDLAPKSRQTGTPWLQRGAQRWVDPSLPEVQGYLLDIVDEVADIGVDEIQLDYVRFPTEGNVQDAVFSSGDSKPKDRVITDFLKQVHDRLEGRQTRLSADVFGIVAWGREADKLATGQSVREMLEHVDVVSPMLYPSHFYGSFEGMEVPAAYPYYFLYQGCRSLLRHADRHGVVVRPWIQAFPYRVDDFDSEYIVEQIRGADAGGARGWLLWNSSMQYGLGLRAIDAVVNGPAEASGSAPSGRWKRAPDPRPEMDQVPEEEAVTKSASPTDEVPVGQGEGDPGADVPASRVERVPESAEPGPQADSSVPSAIN